MPTFVITASWTDQGARAIKDVPKRTKAARELAKKLGVEIKHAFLTTGDSELLLILDAPDGGNVTKFALAISSLGNVRTRTARAWPEAEYVKMVSELPCLSCRADRVTLVGQTRLVAPSTLAFIRL